MKYHESYADSKDKLQLILKLLDDYELPYNPINYAVAYQHVTGINRAMIGVLNQAITRGEVDEYLFECLYDEFIEAASYFQI